MVLWRISPPQPKLLPALVEVANLNPAPNPNPSLTPTHNIRGCIIRQGWGEIRQHSKMAEIVPEGEWVTFQVTIYMYKLDGWITDESRGGNMLIKNLRPFAYLFGPTQSLLL